MIRRLVNDLATGQIRRWYAAAERPEVDAAIRAVYDDIAAHVAMENPVCVASGRCCRFEEYGHRLYCTGLETAWCLRAVDRVVTPTEVERAQDAGTCPFLLNGLCTAHLVRPMGCRIYFCDPAARQWQNDLYERCHLAIISLHEQFGVTYHYAEWRALLRACTPLMPEYWSAKQARRARNRLAGGMTAAPADPDGPAPRREFIQVRVT